MSGPRKLEVALRGWVLRAEEDWTAIGGLLAMGERAPGPTIAFLAQQCVEKYLKALLTGRQIAFARTHDLNEIRALLPEEEDFGASAQDLADLTPYAVATRYSDEVIPVPPEDVALAVEIAARVRDRVRCLLPPGALSP